MRQNYCLRASEANFVKKKSVGGGTAVICDSLIRNLALLPLPLNNFPFHQDLESILQETISDKLENNTRTKAQSVIFLNQIRKNYEGPN